MISLINDDHLESLLRVQVDLLRLGDLLEQVLDDDTVEVPDVSRCDFQVVDRGDDVELELAVRGGREDARVDLDLLHAGAVELAECRDYAGLFAGA